MKAQASPLRRDNLTESVSREIRRMILEGEVAPGDWLPPQPELAERFGVGLSTVREGIKGLTLLGILEPQPGRGTQVSPEALHLLRLYDISRARLEGLDLAHLLEARKTIEVALTVFAAERASADDIARIEQALERMRESVGDSDAFTEADLQFHLAVAQAGQNPLLEAFTMLRAACWRRPSKRAWPSPSCPSLRPPSSASRSASSPPFAAGTSKRPAGTLRPSLPIGTSFCACGAHD